MIRVACVVLACAAVSLNPSAGFASVSVTDIGALGASTQSNIVGLSADGSDVIGWTAYSDLRAIRWNATDGITEQQLPADFVSPFGIDIAVGGSSSVGYAYRQSTQQNYPTRWNSSGAFEDIGLPSGFTTGQAWSVSRNGASIAGVVGQGQATRAALWRRSESGWSSQSLGVLPNGGTTSTSGIISGDGSVVVGVGAVSGSTTTIYRWTQATGMQQLFARPSGTFGSNATAVNIDGSVVVGWLQHPGPVAMKWTQASGPVELGLIPGALGSIARDVSDDGAMVVGGTTDTNGNPFHAFLWRTQGGMVDLNTYLPSIGVQLAGWTLVEAQGISGDGMTIAGNGLHNGFQRGWIVTIPAPGAAMTLICAGTCLRMRRRGSVR